MKLWVAESMSLLFIAGFLLIVLAIVPRIPLPGSQGFVTGGSKKNRVVLFALGLAFLIWSFFLTATRLEG